jgi:hypothetical protein
VDMKFLMRCILKGTKFVAIVPNVTPKPPRISAQIKWLGPERGWIKLNTDGVANSVLGCAGGGGILRDCVGNWIGGFARFLGNCSSLMAELWALKDGLSSAKNLGYVSI